MSAMKSPKSRSANYGLQAGHNFVNGILMGQPHPLIYIVSMTAQQQSWVVTRELKAHKA